MNVGEFFFQNSVKAIQFKLLDVTTCDRLIDFLVARIDADAKLLAELEQLIDYVKDCHKGGSSTLTLTLTLTPTQNR